MVQIQNNVLEYFDDLVYTLFEDEYFGFVENSEDYVNRNVNFILENYKTFPRKQVPTKLQQFGANYIFYKINRRTTWYVFFETNNDDFIVTYLINNHCEEAKYL